MTDIAGSVPMGSENLPSWANPNNHRGGPHFGDLVEQVRRVMDAARVIHADDDLAQELVEDLGKVAARMESVSTSPNLAPADSRVDLPGRGNVSLPPYLMLEDGGEGVAAEVTFRTAQVGEGAAHGGYVSLFFDELAGYAATYAITEGMPRTAYLKVDYRSLTPIHRRLVGRVWVDRTEGRKLFLRGTLHDGDTLCAEMESLFITVPMPTY